ncbi:MAG TPA: BamA/TamA family outer membrane protein [Longimicrobiaceae bacterium]|nr:BamA/TamA family outer membrane protein [Longimicrobiaceae bacterium]
MRLDRALSCGLALVLAGGPSLAAQGARADTATVVAGARYAAGSLEEALLGRSYRDLWTTPVRIPVLPLDTLGGLTPTELGGGNQTISLVLMAPGGREYRFRLVDKDPGRSYGPDLKHTLVHDVMQDQVSSLNPAGALVADRILDAAGLLHASPRLYVMPDAPALGEHRALFAGKLGLLEERPDEVEGRVPGIPGAVEVEGTEDFLEALEETPRHRFAEREYLTARLVDLFLGDWDRHADQWRWARFELGGDRHLWRPIPRDRDYVLVDYDGLLVRPAGRFVPQANRFTEQYRGTISGLVYNAEVLDRLLLGALPGSAWDSAALALRGTLTDLVIDEAVDRLPPEYEGIVGADLRRILRARRDALPEAARTLYARLAVAPEIRGTDEQDYALVERLPGGAVRVRIWAGAEPRGEPYRERLLLPGETEEVRLFLHGGDDQAVVEGDGSDILVRIVGGGGDDRLVDRGRSGRTVFHDARGDNRFARGPGTAVDTREYRGPEKSLDPRADPLRDWGAEFSPFTPFVSWRPFAELVVGGGPTRTRYGFRRHPWASLQSVRALWAPLHSSRFGVEYLGRFRRTGSDAVAGLLASATGLEAAAFYGFGNRTGARLEPEDYVVWSRQLLLQPGLVLPLGDAVALTLGGEARYTDPEVDEGTPAASLSPPGARAFAAAGARAGVVVEQVDDPALAREGFRAELGGAVFPLVAEADGGTAAGFGRVGAVASGYLSPLEGGPTLALRAGGEKLWGRFPFQYAAFVGGSETLRGYSRHRFAGDAALHGTAELRQVLTRLELVTRGDLGVVALADAGRVWHDGRSEGGWHTALGGGVFFSSLGRTLTVTYARGERGILYAGLALPN